MEIKKYHGIIPFDFKLKGEEEFIKIQKEIFSYGISWSHIEGGKLYLPIDNDIKKAKALFIVERKGRNVLFYYSRSIKYSSDDKDAYIKINPKKIKEGIDKLNTLRVLERI